VALDVVEEAADNLDAAEGPAFEGFALAAEKACRRTLGLDDEL
jgi:hypothetical protein